MPDPRDLTARGLLLEGLRLIGYFVRAHPAAFALAVTGASAYAAAIIAAAVVIGQVTEQVIVPALDEGAAPGSGLLLGVVAVVGVAVWKSAGIILRRSAAGWLSFRSQIEARRRLITHLSALELRWYSQQSVGDLLSISENDTRQGANVLGPLPYGTGVSLLLIGSLVLIFITDPWLGLAAFIGLGITALADISGSWRMFHIFEAIQDHLGEVASVAHESFDGALTVKALGREDYETNRFAGVAGALRDRIISAGRQFSTYRAIVEALPVLTTLAVLVVGTMRAGAGAVGPGELVTVGFLLSLLSVPVRLIGYVLWDMSKSLAAWSRVQAVLDVEEKVDYGELQAQPAESGAELSGLAVEFGYDGAGPVLHDLALDIAPGKTVALVGATASGKSTLAMLLARLWDPGSGAIHLDGRDLRRFARSELPREVAYVPQQSFLFHDTVTHNITLGMPLPAEEVVRATSLAGAAGFVADLPEDFQTIIGERGATLSGGQQQRLALARALVRRPRLLILDDATSAVDPSVEAEILRRLKKADLPSTVVMVAYRPSSISLADEVVYLEDGRIVGHGEHRRLLADVPGYARLLRAYEEDAKARAVHSEALQ